MLVFFGKQQAFIPTFDTSFFYFKIFSVNLQKYCLDANFIQIRLRYVIVNSIEIHLGLKNNSP